ncbi:putative glycosyltransferase EpsE [compost metagenome]
MLAIQSILTQSITNWKLILINDGSTDSSPSIAQEFASKDKRVLYIDDFQNRGLIYRLNQISDLTETKYLARMDSDDIMMPDRLKKQLDFLILNPEVDLLDTALYTIDELGNPVGLRGDCDIATNKIDILKSTMLNHATIVGKTSWFRANKYDPKYVRAEDYELWIRTHDYSNFKRLKIPLYIVREGRVSVKNYVKSMNTLRIIFSNYGPNILSGLQLKIEIFKTYLKSGIYIFAGFFNFQHLLSQRRNAPLETEQKVYVSEVISNIGKVII